MTDVAMDNYDDARPIGLFIARRLSGSGDENGQTTLTLRQMLLLTEAGYEEKSYLTFKMRKQKATKAGEWAILFVEESGPLLVAALLKYLQTPQPEGTTVSWRIGKEHFNNVQDHMGKEPELVHDNVIRLNLDAGAPVPDYVIEMVSKMVSLSLTLIWGYEHVPDDAAADEGEGAGN